jgi:hypothetical protein
MKVMANISTRAPRHLSGLADAKVEQHCHHYGHYDEHQSHGSPPARCCAPIPGYRTIILAPTKTSIIKFVDRKSFTPIVEEATKTMGTHPLVVRQPKKEGDKRFRYTLKHPDDPKRLITMTMLLFHIPKPTSSP